MEELEGGNYEMLDEGKIIIGVNHARQHCDLRILEWRSERYKAVMYYICTIEMYAL